MIKPNDISNYINNPTTSFKIINLNINQKIKDILKNFNICRDSVFNHFDASKLLDIHKLKDFFITVGDNDIKAITALSKFIKKILLEVCTEYNKKYCWMTIRVSLPNTQFDIPRWHVDGPYYKSDYIQTKFLLTLKGASTLVIEPKIKKRKEFVNIYEDNDKLKDIKLKDIEMLETQEKRNKLVSTEKIIDILPLLNGIISCSDTPKMNTVGTIHSEPPISDNRIFLSILPMTKDEQLELKTRWTWAN